jgi:iron complex outermembrane receptor protein
MRKLLTLIALVLLGRAGVAQQEPIVLDELIISGNRISIPFAESSRNISLLQKEEMEHLPVQSLHEVLAYVPAVDLRQRGPVGVQADIGIRGGTFEQTLVLVNGIKLTDPQTGHHILSLPFGMDAVSSVEVLKGPGARIYGQNAFAGAVNFITEIPEERSMSFKAYGGGFSTYGGNISLSLPVKEYKQGLFVGFDASEGYRYNTDYQTSHVFYQSEIATMGGNLQLMGGFVDRKFGANGFYASPEATEQYEEVTTSMLSLGFRKKSNSLSLNPRVYWRWNDDRYLFVRGNPSIYENDHTTNVIGVELNTSIENRLGTTGFGMEWRHESIRGDQLRNGTPSISILDGSGRHTAGLYLEHRMRVAGRLDITPGVFINWYSDFGWSAFPGIDVGYNIKPNIRLYANAGRSFRIPTFYDQYYQSPTEQGNPNLYPEDAITYEFGIKYGRKGIHTEFNVFHRDANRLIDWVYDTTDSLWQSKNLEGIRSTGVEISLNVDFRDFFNDPSMLDQLVLSYNFIDQPVSLEETLRSRYALQSLRHQVIMGLDHRWFLKLRNSFRARYIDRQDQQPYWLLDNRIYWQENERLNIFLEITNLLDTEYAEVLTPMPGRWIRAGVQWEFPF